MHQFARPRHFAYYRTKQDNETPDPVRQSSLRDWLAEATNAPHDVAETILGHVVGGTVERAYRRTDFIDQRRALMERWAQHVTGMTGAVVAFKDTANAL